MECRELESLVNRDFGSGRQHGPRLRRNREPRRSRRSHRRHPNLDEDDDDDEDDEEDLDELESDYEPVDYSDGASSMVGSFERTRRGPLHYGRRRPQGHHLGGHRRRHGGAHPFHGGPRLI